MEWLNLYFYQLKPENILRMDKKIWLKVIKDELTLLDELANGMIGDTILSNEEVELAIARARIVVREFEMLLLNIPKQEPAELAIEPVSTVVGEDILEISTNEEAEVPENEEFYLIPDEEPDIVVPPSSHPPIPPSHSLPVPESPSLPVPPSFLPPVPESTLLQLEDQKEPFSQFKATPLKSLKEGLSLNDRYLFQRELFDNDKARLDETVAALDRLSSIHEAVDYLKANFKWNKSEAAEKFVQLVKRRFS